MQYSHRCSRHNRLSHTTKNQYGFIRFSHDRNDHYTWKPCQTNNMDSRGWLGSPGTCLHYLIILTPQRNLHSANIKS
ncbi:unnamed protein product [Cyberlindnera jadinii]|uniref:Uncharacterized protein n=1 Tax=Cyberlindnera jadinii (strain ATCC 18201 / CBS 1600 / BCRC 20928 / JCM 3617 / NBRC 0987 / NRRL Y-1542) TaxID=983966 RepID=A0A0H5C2N8_CYBJN|nr:unnamed protein product [Cyberlindnera jadinii]